MMPKLTFSVFGAVVGLLLAFHTMNVQGALDLAQCKTEYANFFDLLEGIITGGAEAVEATRTTYNTCAEDADSYTALYTCAVNAYEIYETHLRAVYRARAQDIVAAHNNFASDIIPLTSNSGVPAPQPGIPIPAFRQLFNDAMTWIDTTHQRRVGR